MYTLVEPQFREAMRTLCKRYRLHYCDLLGHPIEAVARVSGQPATMTPAARPVLDSSYFKRMAAIEFAVRYDDGVATHGLKDADIVLVGVSRTAKTPLSIYLGYLGYKTANVPIVQGIDPPKSTLGGSLDSRSTQRRSRGSAPSAPGGCAARAASTPTSSKSTRSSSRLRSCTDGLAARSSRSRTWRSRRPRDALSTSSSNVAWLHGHEGETPDSVLLLAVLDALPGARALHLLRALDAGLDGDPLRVVDRRAQAPLEKQSRK